MKWFNNLTTPVKLVLAFGVLWIMLAAVIVTAYRNITGIAQSARLMHEVYFRIEHDLSELRAYMNYNRIQLLEMITGNDGAARKMNVQNIEKNEDRIDALLDGLVRLGRQDARFQSQLAELKNILMTHRQVRERQILLINNGNIQEASRIGSDVQEERFDRIRSIALQLGKDASEEVNMQLALQRQKEASSIRSLLIIGVLALLAGIAMVVLLHVTMARPLGAIAGVAARIASGDLSITVPADGRSDEMGVMMQAFSRMIENLRRMIMEIAEGIALLGSSASEILASTTQVASGSAETAAAISQTTSTVEEVRKAAQLSSEKAKNVSDKAQRVSQVSRDGQNAVEEMAAGIENIREQMEAVARTIISLSEQNRSIGGIIASVTDLADQSNLLAVNAAIEASRAGEQGKGFAVVAQEIKALAEQSKQATAQVRSILGDVQKSTGAAVMATEQGSKAVEAGVKQSARAGEAIRVLAGSSDEALQTATQIVASSREQVVGMDQIGIAMENINQAGLQTAASMRQAETAARNLHDLGQKIKQLTGQFQT